MMLTFMVNEPVFALIIDFHPDLESENRRKILHPDFLIFRNL